LHGRKIKEEIVMEEKLYMISDAAKQVEVESHVLRYWEDELELPIKRNKLGHRYYTTDDVNRLKRVKSMKEQGFQLKAIRRALKQEMQEAGEKKEEQAKLPKEEKKGKGQDEKSAEELWPAKSASYVVKEQTFTEKEDKAYRLQALLKNMVLEVVREENEALCEQIRESLLKELDYQFRMQEEREEQREAERLKREEEHFKQIDELIREKAEKKEKRKKHSFF